MTESATRGGTATARGPAPAALDGGDRPPTALRRAVSESIEFVYRLAGSTLATPRVAVGVSLAGLLLVMVVGILSPNFNTLPPNHTGAGIVPIVLPLSGHLWQLDWWASFLITYLAIVLQCLGLAGLLWANSRGWRPNPRHLFLAVCVIVAVMVNITPVGSSDTASYAAYGRIANVGLDPYINGPNILGEGNAYAKAVGPMWTTTPSVYGPLATWVQQLAAWLGGQNPGETVHFLMIFNGAVFLAVGLFLIKVADDPVRATLMWVANPVLIQQLVAGGHLDTYSAAAVVVGMQLARRGTNPWRYLAVGAAIGVASDFKITAGLVAAGVGYALLMRREWANIARLGAGCLGTIVAAYAFYGFHALTQLYAASDLVSTPSPWRALQLLSQFAFGLFGHAALGVKVGSMVTSALWPIMMIALAYFIYRRFSPDQPTVVTVPFALCFAWLVVAPWTLPWYAALAWVTVALLPRNPMTRWLTLLTVFLALMHSSGGGPAPWANSN